MESQSASQHIHSHACKCISVKCKSNHSSVLFVSCNCSYSETLCLTNIQTYNATSMRCVESRTNYKIHTRNSPAHSNSPNFAHCTDVVGTTDIDQLPHDKSAGFIYLLLRQLENIDVYVRSFDATQEGCLGRAAENVDGTLYVRHIANCERYRKTCADHTPFLVSSCVVCMLPVWMFSCWRREE